ncbi:MAG: hypothetical protein ACREV9_12130 [Burkholderiales bacterium]
MQADRTGAGVALYSDFNCPYCYALGERLFAAASAHRVEWRGVQHAPYLPIPMASAGAALAAELSDEVGAIRRLAPEVSITLPRGKPNTGPAIRAVSAQASSQYACPGDQTQWSALSGMDLLAYVGASRGNRAPRRNSARAKAIECPAPSIRRQSAASALVAADDRRPS